MKYICMIRAEVVMEHMPEAEAASLFNEYAAFTETIKASGHLLGGNRLKPAETATTVRVRNDKLVTTDGPFAETKEQLGGYYLIEATDLNEAIGIAAKIPGARLGSVEVRQVAEDAQTRALGLNT